MHVAATLAARSTCGVAAACVVLQVCNNLQHMCCLSVLASMLHSVVVHAPVLAVLRRCSLCLLALAVCGYLALPASMLHSVPSVFVSPAGAPLELGVFFNRRAVPACCLLATCLLVSCE
jgi:hypothetical protein